MLASSNRMRRKTEFGEALRHGRRASARRLNAYLAASTHEVDAVGSQSTPRIGFIVSRTVGPAVVRNRVRRRLRALARDRIADLPDTGLLVIRAHPPAASAAYEELRSDLEHVLTRLLVPESSDVGTGSSRSQRIPVSREST